MALLAYPLWLFASVLIVLTGVVEVGFRLMRRAAVNVDREHHEQIQGTRNDVAVLLSLFLGFTLAMVLGGLTCENSSSYTRLTPLAQPAFGQSCCQSKAAARFRNCFGDTRKRAWSSPSQGPITKAFRAP
jgi:hypothetical protein